MAKPTKREWQNPDGSTGSNWQVRYEDRQGKRRSKSFDRKRDADKWIAEELPAIMAGAQLPDRDTVTVEKATEIWLDAVRRGRHGREGAEPATLRQYESHVRLHIMPFLGGAKLTEVNGPRVVAFRDELLDAGRSRALVKKVLASLGGIYSEAKSRGLVAVNPVDGVTLIRSSRHEEALYIPEKAIVRALIDRARAWRDEPPRAEQTRSNGRKTTQRRFSDERLHWWYMLVRTAAATGMRLSELRGLSWRTVDLKNGSLSVEQRADETGRIGPTKTAAGRRKIALSVEHVKELKEWRLRCPRRKPVDGQSEGDLDLVFPNGEGKPERAPNIYNRFWLPMLRELRLVDQIKDAATGETREEPRFGFHALRHFRASVLIESGADVKEVQGELGHSSAQMTLDVYGHLFNDEERERVRASRADILDKALFQAPKKRGSGDD